MAFAYAQLRGEAEIPPVADLLGWSFGFPPAEAAPWLDLAGLANVRVLRDDGRVIAAAFVLPMGQFFGGKSVPMVGVAAVGTAPDRRGGGAALSMMRSMMLEMREAGFALSTLYPASRALYRKAGYEVAGQCSVAEVPVRMLRSHERPLDVRPATPGDFDAMERAYRAQAAQTPGHLDRGAYIWHRIRNPRGELARGFVFERKGTLEGYVYLYEKRRMPTYHYDLRLTDAVATTPDAARALLAFLGDHATLGVNAEWATGPVEPLVMMLPEIDYAVRLGDHWMVRVLDVKRALAARGYAEGIETEVHFDVRDDLVAENQGRFVLSVAGGVGKVRRGGRGRIALDVRGLAAMVAGQWTPHAIVASGLAEGPVEELRRAALALGGTSPWMCDRF